MRKRAKVLNNTLVREGLDRRWKQATANKMLQTPINNEIINGSNENNEWNSIITMLKHMVCGGCIMATTLRFFEYLNDSIEAYKHKIRTAMPLFSVQYAYVCEFKCICLQLIHVKVEQHTRYNSCKRSKSIANELWKFCF